MPGSRHPPQPLNLPQPLVELVPTAENAAHQLFFRSSWRRREVVSPTAPGRLATSSPSIPPASQIRSIRRHAADWADLALEVESAATPQLRRGVTDVAPRLSSVSV